MEKISKNIILPHLANAVTVLGMISAAAFFITVYYYPEQLWLSAIFATLAASSDLLDGWMARKLKISSPIGRFLDQSRDRVFIFPSMLILIWNNRWKIFLIPLPAKIITQACIAVILVLELIILLIWTKGASLYWQGKEIDFSPNKWGKRKTFTGFSIVMAWIYSLTAEQHLDIEVIKVSCWLIIAGMALMIYFSWESIKEYYKRIEPTKKIRRLAEENKPEL
jgi:phosphatidylglycerophosphate synthase